MRTQLPSCNGWHPNMPTTRASDWFLALEDAIESLANMPLRCALAPENTEFPFEVRQLLYGRPPHVYRILFTIETSTVYVLHIRHGRRRHLSEI